MYIHVLMHLSGNKNTRIQHNNCGDLILMCRLSCKLHVFVSLINKFLNAVIHDLSISHVDQ